MKYILLFIFIIMSNSNYALQSVGIIDSLYHVTLTDTILHEDYQEELINFINSEIKYPEQRLAYQISGTINVRLSINTRSLSIEQIRFTQLSDDFLRKEVLRVIALLSTWKFHDSDKGIKEIWVSFRFDPNGQGVNIYKNGEFTINGNLQPVIHKSITR